VTQTPEFAVVFEEPELRFAADQPDPTPPATAKGRADAAMQMRQAWNDSFTQAGGEAVDGTMPDQDGSQM
jgi:hypothetical protein